MDIQDKYKKAKEGLRSAMGRNALTFLGFLAISTVFWFLLALNDEVQHDYKLPVKLIDFPHDMTVISGFYPTINVTVKDKGSSLSKFSWGGTPVLKLPYEEFAHPRPDHLLYAQSQLNSAIRSIFGSSSTIVGMRPDSLDLYYTTEPGIPVPVKVNAEITTATQYVAYEPVKVTPDSVMIFSNSRDRIDIRELNTIPVTLTNLKDTADVNVHLELPTGMRAVPSSVKLTFPVEPLVSRTRQLIIEALNVPDGHRLVTFPAVVEFTHLLPRSLYNSEDHPVKAYVDYKDIEPGTSSLPVSLSLLPAHYRSASVVPEKVEFVVEEE